MLNLLLRCVLGCLLTMTLALPAAAGQRIWVALTQEGGLYEEAALALKGGLGSSVELRIAPWPALADEKEAAPDLIVTVGASAFEDALKGLRQRGPSWGRVPLLATLLPQSAYETTLLQAGAIHHPLSAVLLDQPVRRQIALIRRAFPDRQRIGAVLGPQTTGYLPILQSEAARHGLTLVAAGMKLQDDLYPAMKKVIEGSDILLAMPDPAVFNPATVQQILLTTYRARIPLVAFSASYVKAGAVLALYSTPAQVMQRAVEMIELWRAGNRLPSPQGPREFSVATNPKVAASLGLALEDPAEILRDLRQLEGLK